MQSRLSITGCLARASPTRSALFPERRSEYGIPHLLYSNARVPALPIRPSSSSRFPNLQPLPGQRRSWDKDIVVDDLALTVDAHRRTNELLATENNIRDADYGVVRRRMVHRDLTTGEKELSYNRSLPSKHLEGKIRKVSSTSIGKDTIREVEVYDSPVRRSGNTYKARRVLRLQRMAKPIAPVEYEGQNIEPVEQWRYRNTGHLPQHFQPWTRFGRGFQNTGLEQLSHEIENFESWIKLTYSEQAAVQQCIDDIRVISDKVLPKNPLVLHGSHATGLATPLSDVDLCITDRKADVYLTERGPSTTHPNAKKTAKKALFKLATALEENDSFYEIRLVYASVSMLSFRQRKSGLSVQIIYGARVGPTTEFTNYYLAEYPQLRQLYLIVRQMLLIRGLTSVYEGGVGSYSLLVMILTALKHNPDLTTRDGLGTQLLTILKFWADADTYSSGYAPDPPRLFEKQLENFKTANENDTTQGNRYEEGTKILAHENWKRMNTPNRPRYPYLLSLQDPANPINDLGRRATSIKHIQAVFKAACENILGEISKWDSDISESRKDGFNGLLVSLVGANYWMFNERRTQLMRARPNWRENATSFRRVGGSFNKRTT